MNNIIYDNEIIKLENNTWNYYYNFIKKLNLKDCVKLSLFCAKIVSPNTKENNLCIELIEKWLVDENSVSREELSDAANTAWTAYISSHATVNAANAIASYAAYSTDAAYAIWNSAHNFNASCIVYSTSVFNIIANTSIFNINKSNKYLQILLRKTKQFGNNKILEQISKTDVDKLELVDWNMITDIMLEEYNIVHEFEYEDIFSRRCLIELLRKEYF